MNPGTGKIRPASGRAKKRKKSTKPGAQSINGKTSGRSAETHRRSLEKIVESPAGGLTERDRAVDALRESEKRYRHLVKHAPAGIYEVDFTNGHFTEVNDVMCLLLGYTRGELLALTAFDILDDEGKANFAGRVRRAQSGETLNDAVEYRVRTKDGRMIWGLLNVMFRWTGGKIVGAMVVAHDITERKRVEEALQESEARFKAIAEATPVGIGVVGLPDATFLYVNPAYLKGFGYGESEILGKGTPQIYWSNEERDRALAILKEKGSVAEYEVKLKRKDGTPFWGLSSVRPITFNGRPALLGSFVDITDRKIAEDKLKQASEELHRSNEELAFFNNAMVGRELRMIELKKEINQLCHQFGQPLRYNCGSEGAAGSIESAQ